MRNKKFLNKKQIFLTTVLSIFCLATFIVLGDRLSKRVEENLPDSQYNQIVETDPISYPKVAENEVAADAINKERERLARRNKDFIVSPDHQVTLGAWLPDWGTNPGIKSLQDANKPLQNLSPVWYEIKENGELVDKRPRNYKQVLDLARKQDAEITPAIAMFDHNLFSKVLANNENIDRHVEAIANAVFENEYDGIDLDYESTKLSDKEAYFLLLEKLAEKLDAQGKRLVVTVLAKWGDGISYPSFKETRAVQDWTRISFYADEIRIMAYDYTYSKSKYPGPIAPLDWQRAVLEYAVQLIPREKITLGVHLHSYEWWQSKEAITEIRKTSPDLDPLVFHETLESNPLEDVIAESGLVKFNNPRSYTYSTIKRVLRENKGPTIDFQGEKVFRYEKVNDSTKVPEERVLVYIDPEGIKAREDLAKEFGVGKICFWRLGGEEDLL